jgi:hypothetical protein
MNDRRNQFQVDFTYSDGNSEGRMKIQGNVNQLGGATSEFAILEHVRRQYPNYNVTIMNVKWM